MEEHVVNSLTPGSGLGVFLKWGPKVLVGAFIVGMSWMAVKLRLKSTKESQDKLILQFSQFQKQQSEFELQIATINLKITELQNGMLDIQKELAEIQLDLEMHKKEMRALIYDDDNALRFITYASHDHMQTNCHSTLEEVFKRITENVARMEANSIKQEEHFSKSLDSVRVEIGTLVKEVAGLSAIVRNNGKRN